VNKSQYAKNLIWTDRNYYIHPSFEIRDFDSGPRLRTDCDRRTSQIRCRRLSGNQCCESIGSNLRSSCGTDGPNPPRQTHWDPEEWRFEENPLFWTQSKLLEKTCSESSFTSTPHLPCDNFHVRDRPKWDMLWLGHIIPMGLQRDLVGSQQISEQFLSYYHDCCSCFRCSFISI
jgi:hypothetical protein